MVLVYNANANCPATFKTVQGASKVSTLLWEVATDINNDKQTTILASEHPGPSPRPHVAPVAIRSASTMTMFDQLRLRGYAPQGACPGDNERHTTGTHHWRQREASGRAQSALGQGLSVVCVYLCPWRPPSAMWTHLKRSGQF